MLTVRAIYQDGVFYPIRPITLANRTVVDMACALVQPNPADMDEGEWAQRLKDAKTPEEWYELSMLGPDDPDDGYDLMTELAKNGRLRIGRSPESDGRAERAAS